MTTVLRRVSEISDLEHFDISVLTNRGKIVRVTTNGVLRRWPHENATKGTKTVAAFKEQFRAAYPGYDCQVINEDGTEAHANTLLRTVRETYEE